MSKGNIKCIVDISCVTFRLQNEKMKKKKTAKYKNIWQKPSFSFGVNM
jgi:hypothetical protein